MEIDQVDQTGSASAAILAAGIGLCSFGIGVCLSEASKPVASAFTLYKPTGPLSGKVAFGIAVWLLAWFLLARMWSGKPVGVRKPFVVSLILIGIGLAITFPPVMELLTHG